MQLLLLSELTVTSLYMSLVSGKRRSQSYVDPLLNMVGLNPPPT